MKTISILLEYYYVNYVKLKVHIYLLANTTISILLSYIININLVIMNSAIYS